MTPSSSIASFTGMFDSKDSKMGESMTTSQSTIPTVSLTRLKAPTKIATSLSGSSQDITGPASTSTHIPKPSGIPSVKENIRQMVEKIETKCDEKIKEESDAQDISRKHPIQSSSSFDEATSKENAELKEKLTDLQSKLDTIMAIRAQDKLKFKELERLKIQNEQLLENKRQMSEKVADLSKLKAAAEKAAQEAREEQQAQNEEMKDLIDNAEMAVIDKEMAENRVETLQIELESIKEQLEEKTLDYELLKSEIEDKGADGAANSFQVKQLEEQNARFREALLKFRDISASDRNNIQHLQKEADTKSEEINQLIALKEKNAIEIQRFTESIQELTVSVLIVLFGNFLIFDLSGTSWHGTWFTGDGWEANGKEPWVRG